MVGAAFGFFGFKSFQTETYYILWVLSVCLMMWLMMEFKMLPQYQMNVRGFFYRTFQAPYEAFCETQEAKKEFKAREKAKKLAQLNAENNGAEEGEVVETQETRRLRIEAENQAKEALLEKERIEKKAQIDREEGIRLGRLQIMNEQKDQHEQEYLEKYGISIEDNLIYVESTKTAEVNEVLAKKARLPQKDPNATNDW